MRSGSGGTLKGRILLALSIPFVVSMAISVFTVVYLVDNLLVSQVQRKVSTDLSSARELYAMRVELLKDLVRFSANIESVKRAVGIKDAEGLKAALQSVRVRSGEDFLTVADPEGRVIARMRNPSASGDQVAHIAPIRAALIGETAGSTELLDERDLRLEGEELAERARIALLDTQYAAPTDKKLLASGLALVAAAPVTDEAGRVIGVVYAGHLLNRDYSLVDKVRSTVFADHSVDGVAVGAASILLGDVRISTNVLADNGQRAVGTRVSESVAEKVLKEGAPFVDRAFVVKDWYISAYEPLRNSRGQVAGILTVGILEKPYRDLVFRSILVVGALQFLGIGVGLFYFTSALARSVLRPLGRLSEGALRIGSGDLRHEIPVESNDEIGKLAADFNYMTKSLRERDSAIEELTRDLEKKVAERNEALANREADLRRARSEVLEIMEKQKETNLELQQSFERLKETQEELVRSGKLAALGAMAAGVAHEINTPLATIRGNVEIMTLKLKEIPECADELLRIEQQADRMQGIVQNLLTFARVEKPYAEPTDIRKALVDVIQSLGPRAVEKNVVIVADLPDFMPPVMAGFDKLLQVFNNLANNALQAMPHGGRFTMAATVDDERGEVRVSFTDTGVGIAPQDIPKVWNPFFSTKPAGTGLGLSISHAIIEGFGGRITLVSEPGKGATFTVHLSKAL